ncbi:MAG: ATP-binding protein, partial [Magnetococcales bacterium]|nr:ATP-binding protein [Magnetococcales bacterium]MBF0117060.1 ATP-binding protein [Magnetococcales bacterium]
MFCGGPGTGKTHLAAAMIQAAITVGRTAAYLSVYDLVLLARSTYVSVHFSPGYPLILKGETLSENNLFR